MKISKDRIYSFLKGFIVAVLILILSPAYALDERGAENDLIVIGGSSNFPPYEFIDKDGNPKGYNVELTRAVAKVMGMNIAVSLGPWSEIYNALEAEKIDVVQGMFYSEKRDQVFDFTPPHIFMSHVVFTRGNSVKINSVEDIRGKEIIVMRDGSMHEYAIENQLTDKLVLVETQAEALRLLSSGKHDYVLATRLPGLHWIKEMKLDNVFPTEVLIGEGNYCYAVKEGNIRLMARFSEGLALLKKSGKYQKIYNKWVGMSVRKSIAKAKVTKVTLFVLLPLLSLLAGTLFWSWSLKKKVFERTMELAKEIGERKRTEQKLRESEEKFRSISDSANDAIIMMDNSGNISFWNEAAEKIFGYSEEEALGEDLHKLLAPERYHRLFKENFVKFRIKGEGPAIGETLEVQALKKDGTEFPIEISLSTVKLESKWNAIGMVRDITERKENEAKIRASLEEKELLLNEIHFRVRNNMQAISSIIALQSATDANEKITDAFNECQNRIKSMALVHEEIYRTKDFSKIDIKEYIETLTHTLLDSYKEKVQNISFEIDTKDIYLDIDTSINVGLILNELVTNSLKHAFPDGKQGTIQVGFQNINKERIELKVRDNGIGLPDGFNIRDIDSLGLKLVTLLTEVQLGGRVEVKQDNGTEFRLVMKKAAKISP